MIAIAMYISLGVFVTLLLTMLLLPLIWRRAVRLTEKRIKAEMPISYTELRAEKDMQRAEQAFELRRLEVTTEASLEEVANQTLKINRLQSTLSDRDDEIEAHKTKIASLENSLSDQTDQTTETEGSLSTTKDELAAARSVIAGLEDTKAGLEREIVHLETGLSEQKIETVAQMAQIENFRDELGDMTGKLKETTTSLAEARAQLSQRNSDLDRSKERLGKQQARIDALQSELADKDTDIETLTRRLDRAQSQVSNTESDGNERFAAAEAARVQAEAKIASMAMQLEHANRDIGEGDVTDLITRLQGENAELHDKLSRTKEQLSAFRAKLEQEQLAASDNGDSDATLSPQELLLRNEMKKIAAQVTGFAAQMEGPNSPIHNLLEQAETADEIAKPSPATNGKGNGNGNGLDHQAEAQQAEPQLAEITNTPSDETAEATRQNEPWDEVFSLADRIRDLNKSNEEKSPNR